MISGTRKVRMKIKPIIFVFLIFNVAHVLAEDKNIIPPVIIKKTPSRSLTSGSSTTITQHDIQTSGVTTLSQALQNLGGIQIQDLAGNSSQVLLSLRGFGANASSNTLLLINGIPIVNPDLAPPDLNAIPLNEIKAISITAGSESVLYGDQAVGGVININTDLQADHKYLFSCVGGSYSQANCSIAVTNFYKQLKYTVTINRDQTENYREHNDYTQNLFSATALYTYATGKIRFFLNAENEAMQFPGALTLEQVRQDRRQATNSIDDFKDNNGFVFLQWIQELPNDWKFKINASRRQMGGDGVLSVPFTQDRTTNFIKPELSGNIGKWLVISGFELQQDHYDLNSSFGNTNNDQQKYSVFGLGNYPLTSSLHFSAGVRGAMQDDQLVSFENENTVNRAFASTVGLNYEPFTHLNFYLRRAGSYRFPKADENADATEGVTGLKTQRGVAYETGFEEQNNQYEIRGGLYQLNLQDEIAFDPMQTPEQPFGSNRNLPPTTRKGFTLSGRDQLTDKLQILSQVNVVDAVFQNGVNAGNRIPLVSELLIHGGINYKFTDNWQLYTEALFTGNQFTANDDANIGVKLGGYTVYNLNFRYVMKSFTAALHVNNIFNKYYYFYTVYEPGDPSEFYYPAPARNVTLSVSYAI